MIELFTQTHYLKSIEPDSQLSPLFKDVFLYHWKEESQHARIDELEWVRENAGLSAEERNQAVDDMIALVGQSERNSVRPSGRRSRILPDGKTRRSIRRESKALTNGRPVRTVGSTILSGFEGPRFQRVLSDMITAEQMRTIEAALAPLIASAGRANRVADVNQTEVEVMNPNKALWEKGDFTQIAAFMRESGEALVESLGVKPPLRVLDLGCGDGTTAVPLARLGQKLLESTLPGISSTQGKRRAVEAGLRQLKFQEGDACNLDGCQRPFLDLTVSVFGAMFASKPFDVAKEMVRVTKPGGRIVMGNWIPNDPTFVSQLLKVSSLFTPPPPDGFVSPMMWGVETHIVERFGQAGVPKEKISMAKDTYHFVSPRQGPGRSSSTCSGGSMAPP